MKREDTEALLDEFHTPVHVRAHSFLVARIAELLAKKLNDVGIPVDIDLTWTAGMIHDFVRVVDFKSLDDNLGTEEDRKVWRNLREKYAGRHHADVGAQILEEKEEVELAEIVRQHQYTAISGKDAPHRWEAKLVYYADKRCAHDKIVSLQERMEEGKRRHFPNEPLTAEEAARRRKVFALEQEIFGKIDLNPEEIADELGED